MIRAARRVLSTMAVAGRHNCLLFIRPPPPLHPLSPPSSTLNSFPPSLYPLSIYMSPLRQKSPRLFVLLVVLLSALAVSEASMSSLMQALFQPPQPLITGIKGNPPHSHCMASPDHQHPHSDEPRVLLLFARLWLLSGDDLRATSCR